MSTSSMKTYESVPSADCASALMLTQFNQQFFNERLHHILHQTNHYDGTITSSWEKIQRENDKAPQIETATLDGNIEVGNGAESARHIQQLVQRIRNAGIECVVLEAAHAYSHQRMGDESFVRSMEMQYAEAKKLTDALTKNRVNITRVLFVDNYNPNPISGNIEDNLDVEEYVSLARACGFPPDALIWEADMVPVARAMINFMREHQSLVVEKGSGRNGNAGTSDLPEKKLYLDHRGIELFSVAKNKVSCSALDAALSIMKFLHLGQGIINVLPRRQHAGEFSFGGQQKKVRQILMNHLDVRVMPFFNLFTSEVDDTPHSSGAHNAFRKKPRAI